MGTSELHRLLLRLPQELFARVRARANEAQLSLNTYIMEVLSQAQGVAKGQPGLSIAGTSLDVLAVQKIFKSRVVGLVLFGSVARGESLDVSDIDLLFVLESGTLFSRSHYAQLDALLPTDTKVSVQVACLPEDIRVVSSLWFEVALDGVVLWERDHKLASFLSQLRRHILSSAHERKSSSGQAYWRLGRGN